MFNRGPSSLRYVGRKARLMVLARVKEVHTDKPSSVTRAHAAVAIVTQVQNENIIFDVLFVSEWASLCVRHRLITRIRRQGE